MIPDKFYLVDKKETLSDTTERKLKAKGKGKKKPKGGPAGGV